MEDGTTVCYPQYSQNPAVETAACCGDCCHSNIISIRRWSSGIGHRMDRNPKAGVSNWSRLARYFGDVTLGGYSPFVPGA
jgi:hypothetical protein